MSILRLRDAETVPGWKNKAIGKLEYYENFYRMKVRRQIDAVKLTGATLNEFIGKTHDIERTLRLCGVLIQTIKNSELNVQFMHEINGLIRDYGNELKHLLIDLILYRLREEAVQIHINNNNAIQAATTNFPTVYIAIVNGVLIYWTTFRAKHTEFVTYLDQGLDFADHLNRVKANQDSLSLDYSLEILTKIERNITRWKKNLKSLLRTIESCLETLNDPRRQQPNDPHLQPTAPALLQTFPDPQPAVRLTSRRTATGTATASSDWDSIRHLRM